MRVWASLLRNGFAQERDVVVFLINLDCLENSATLLISQDFLLCLYDGNNIEKGKDVYLKCLPTGQLQDHSSNALNSKSGD